jgi:hypothetical protein
MRGRDEIGLMEFSKKDDLASRARRQRYAATNGVDLSVSRSMGQVRAGARKIG